MHVWTTNSAYQAFARENVKHSAFPVAHNGVCLYLVCLSVAQFDCSCDGTPKNVVEWGMLQNDLRREGRGLTAPNIRYSEIVSNSEALLR